MIKASFKNIGPIKDAELELGDLTIIAGQNNTGKTYLVYTLYGFLRMIEERQFMRYTLSFEASLNRKITTITNKMRSTGKATLGIEYYKTLKHQLMQAMSKYFSSRLLDQAFSSPNEEFRYARFHLEKSTQKTVAGLLYKKSGASIKSSIESNKLILEFENPKNDEFFSIGHGVISLLIHMMNYPDTFILSAERFGISLFYKELDFKKNWLVEQFQNLSNDKNTDLLPPRELLESESARYTKPIRDNINFTRDLANIKKQKGELSEDKDRSVDKIMSGDYRIKNDEIRFISKKRGDGRFDIPLHLASSSARGVSDLYFYWKHIAKKGQLLIIDEPESHLSPTNQILMARLLVFYVNCGIKVLVTTHSDYLIKEINNLIMLSNDFEGKEDFLKRNKKYYTETDCLKPESVKAYVCEDGGLQSCSVDETGIDMPVFDEAIDKINEISMKLALLTKNR